MLISLFLSACIGPLFVKRKVPWEASPPLLQGEFVSEIASVHLRWSIADSDEFVGYQIQKKINGDFKTIAQLDDIVDTSFVHQVVDSGILQFYRIGYSYLFEGQIYTLISNSISGSLHNYNHGWTTSSNFIPTRIAIGTDNIVNVVGAGNGVIERFGFNGEKIDPIIFTDKRIACIETSVLDGPAIAVDSMANIYVSYNVTDDGKVTSAYWSKYSSHGEHKWTRSLEGLFARHIVVNGDDVFIESVSQLHHFDLDGKLQNNYLIPAQLVSSLRVWLGRFAALIEPVSLLDNDWQTPRLVVYDTAERLEPSIVIGRDAKSQMDRGHGVLRRPTDFVLDEVNGRAFVVNAGQSRIDVFSSDRHLTSWGRFGDETGEFRFTGELEVFDGMVSGGPLVRSVIAGGIAIDNSGFIYVADSFNNRIQKFYP